MSWLATQLTPFTEVLTAQLLVFFLKKNTMKEIDKTKTQRGKCPGFEQKLLLCLTRDLPS